MSDEDLGLANVILPNGARYYVDHAHPEYSTPECLTPRDLVIHDKAGERILERSLDVLAADMPADAGPVDLQEQLRRQGQLLRHPRELPGRPRDPVRRHRPRPDAVLRHRARSSPAPARSGSRGTGTTARRPATSSPQRADFFETEVGLETTLKRPIINTRDEPHADPEKYRRLHVIVGDANMCEVAQFLKVGTTAIVLKMIEDGFLPDFSLVEPVRGDPRGLARPRPARRWSSSPTAGA